MVRRWWEKKVQCNLAEAGAQWLYLPAICAYGQCCAALSAFAGLKPPVQGFIRARDAQGAQPSRQIRVVLS
jgi:hypothetical protein